MSFAKQMKWSAKIAWHRMRWLLLILAGLTALMPVTNLIMPLINGKSFGSQDMPGFFLLMWVIIIPPLFALGCTIYNMLSLYMNIKEPSFGLEKASESSFWKKLSAKWLTLFLFNALFMLVIGTQFNFYMDFMSSLLPQLEAISSDISAKQSYGFIAANENSFGSFFSPAMFTTVPLYAVFLALGYIIAGSLGKNRGGRVIKTLVIFIALVFVRSIFQPENILDIVSVFTGKNGVMLAQSPPAMGIIGGADGPTAIFVTSKLMPRFSSVIIAIEDLVFTALSILFAHKLVAKRFDLPQS